MHRSQFITWIEAGLPFCNVTAQSMLAFEPPTKKVISANSEMMISLTTSLYQLTNLLNCINIPQLACVIRQVVKEFDSSLCYN